MRNDCDGFFAALGWMAFAPDPAARFERQKHDRLGVYRLTLAFSHAVGEGYLAGAPDTTVTTRKARCLIDRLGFLVRCYPVLRG